MTDIPNLLATLAYVELYGFISFRIVITAVLVILVFLYEIGFESTGKASQSLHLYFLILHTIYVGFPLKGHPITFDL